MTEQQYQTKILKKLEELGYYVLKLISTNKNGIPDLLGLKAGAPPLFVEVKAKNGRPSKLQLYRIEELKGHGFEAFLTFAGDDFLATVEKKSTKDGEEPEGKADKIVNLSKPF